jgi:hypothetical protein
MGIQYVHQLLFPLKYTFLSDTDALPHQDWVEAIH